MLDKLAHEEHEIWSSWMKYLFSKCDFGLPSVLSSIETGSCIIPKWAVDRWSKQMNTPYSELSEKEKQSDIDVVIEHHKSLKELLK